MHGARAWGSYSPAATGWATRDHGRLGGRDRGRPDRSSCGDGCGGFVLHRCSAHVWGRRPICRGPRISCEQGKQQGNLEIRPGVLLLLPACGEKVGMSGLSASWNRAERAPHPNSRRPQSARFQIGGETPAAQSKQLRSPKNPLLALSFKPGPLYLDARSSCLP